MSEIISSWERITELVEDENYSDLIEYIETLTPSETARAISRLSEAIRHHLFELLSPENAAEVIEDIPEVQAADFVEEMSSEKAAAIMEELDSDHLVDVLGEMDQESSDAILAKMDSDEAEEARKFLEYPPDCAGGLMISEYLSYTSEKTVQDVLDDMQVNRDEYSDYHVQYFYVVDSEEKLVGILQMHSPTDDLRIDEGPGHGFTDVRRRMIRWAPSHGRCIGAVFTERSAPSER